MFPVTRPIRQAAATAAMLALTVVPTVYVLWTAWSIRRPSHRIAVAADLGRRLGCEASVGTVGYPRPGEVVYRDVVLRHQGPGPRGPLELARAKSVRLKGSGRELTLETEGLSLRAEDPKAALTEVGALLQRSADAPQDRVVLSAPTCDLNLGGGGAPYRLTDLVADFSPGPDAPTVKASYRDASPGPATRCELTLTRDHKAEPVKTTLVVKTLEGLPLPARVLAPLFDADDWLGRDAKVEGALTLRQHGDKDWEVEFQGLILDIDLADLVGQRFPNQRLTGKARLKVDSSRWADRPGQGTGWVEARGELSAADGSMSLGLVQSLCTEMKFRKGPKLFRIVSAGIVDLEYQSVGFAFAMTPDGEIKVTGALGADHEPDAVIVSPIATLAFAPEGASHVRGLIKTLFPPANIDVGAMVPLTEQSRLLLRLPVGPDLAAKPLRGN